MTDKTQIAFGGARYVVPRLAKRAAEAAVAAGLTATAMLAVLLLNAALTGTAKRGGSWVKGYDAWLAFVTRSDILGTMLLTAFITVAFVYWSRARELQRR